MNERKFGLFRSPKKDDFATEEEVRRDLVLRGDLPDMEVSTKVEKGFLERAAIHKKRSREFRELEPENENKVRIVLPRTSLISLIGDTHIGDASCHVERIMAEHEAIKNTPDSYMVYGGDGVHGVGWQHDTQVLSLDEQHGMLRTFLKELKGKIILGVEGQHDQKWSRRNGPNAMGRFTEDTHAPLVRGVAEVEIQVGKQTYNAVIGHNLKGSSIYNNAHPSMRASREIQGADLYVNFDNHRKGIVQQPIKDVKNSRMATFVSGGAYIDGDGYAKDSGYPTQDASQMYGSTVRLHADRHEVEVCPDIIQAHKKWGGYRERPKRVESPPKVEKKNPNNGLFNQNLRRKK